MMKGVIELHEMEFWAGHGCYELEKVVGNRFVVSLWIETDLAKAAATDDLSDSISYLELYELVRTEMGVTSNILENVAKRVIDSIYSAFPQADNVKVKISKIAPPLGGKVGSATVILSR